MCVLECERVKQKQDRKRKRRKRDTVVKAGRERAREMLHNI